MAAEQGKEVSSTRPLIVVVLVGELSTAHILPACSFHSSRWDSTASGVETFVSVRNLA